MREIIGRTDIQPALTEARGTVEAEARTLLQATLDEYQAGIEITELVLQDVQPPEAVIDAFNDVLRAQQDRSEEHTSELQSLMRISYAVFCLKKKNQVQQSTL